MQMAELQNIKNGFIRREISDYVLLSVIFIPWLQISV